jgi:arylsulfatase A-like enzyme
VRDNQFDKALEDNHTLGTVLRGAGYATAAIGKWGLQGGPETKEGAAQGPDEWAGYPTKRGFDFFHGYVRHRDGHAQYPKEDGKQVWENKAEISDGLAGCYTTDLFTARAKHWIQEQQRRQPRQPFFLYLAYATPHAKLQLPPGPFPAGGVQWQNRPGQMINTATGTPDSFIHPDYAAATWDHDKNPATPEQAWPDVYQRYATVVRRIDDCVGDLLQHLKDLAIDNETLVVFTTDNGPSMESYLPEKYEPNFFNSFGPFDGIKRDVLEGGIRVGALVRWPGGAPAGRISDVPGQFHDWMATFAEMAGVPAPARTDGVSLLPAISGQGSQSTSRVYVEYFNNQKSPNYPEFTPAHRGRGRQQMQAIREGDFIGVRYQVKSHADPFEIYHVTDDPQQVRNLAADRPALQKQFQDTVLRLRRPDAAAPRPYDDAFVPALAPDAAVNPGVRWRTFAETGPWLARLDDLVSAAEGVAATVEAPAGTLAGAMMFSGFFETPAPGEYTLTLPTGTVALLRVHEATVIDAAFKPAGSETTGSIRLAAGRHPFRLYWSASSSEPPQLEISGPGLKRQPVPSRLLRHQ